MARTAAFFDLDKTIIATSSATAFSRPFFAGGLITRRDVLRTAYAQFLFLLGRADADQTDRLRAFLSSMVAGWDVAQVSSIVNETLHLHIEPTVYAEALALIDEHHAAGRDVVVVSGSGAELVSRSPRCWAPTTSSPPRWRSWTAGTPGGSRSTTSGRTRPPRSSSWPPNRATTSRSATPTRTRSPTHPCWTPSATAPLSTPIAGCGGWRPSGAGTP